MSRIPKTRIGFVVGQKLELPLFTKNVAGKELTRPRSAAPVNRPPMSLLLLRLPSKMMTVVMFIGVPSACRSATCASAHWPVPHRTPARTTGSRSGSIRIDDSRGGRRCPGTRRATRIGANTADLRGIDAARSARLSIAE